MEVEQFDIDLFITFPHPSSIEMISIIKPI